MDFPQQRVFLRGNILSLVDEHQSVTGRELSARFYKHGAQRVSVRRIHPRQRVFLFELFHGFTVEPPRDVGARFTLAKLARFGGKAQRAEKFGKQFEPFAHPFDGRPDLAAFRKQFFAPRDTVGIGIRFLGADLSAVTFEIGDFARYDFGKRVQIFHRPRKHLFRPRAGIFRAAVKFHELTEECVGRSRLFVQDEREKLFRLRKRAQKRAEGFGKIKSAVAVVLHFAEYAAPHAHRRVFDFGIALSAPHAVVVNAFGNLAAFFAREQAVQPFVKGVHPFFYVGGKSGRIQI